MANYYSEKQIKKVREIDLLTYLQTYKPKEKTLIQTWHCYACLRDGCDGRVGDGCPISADC